VLAKHGFELPSLKPKPVSPEKKEGVNIVVNIPNLNQAQPEPAPAEKEKPKKEPEPKPQEASKNKSSDN